ncbi:MAG TPA: hypothetical protein VGJ93_02230 [Desulfuromonadaceae bacterium]
MPLLVKYENNQVEYVSTTVFNDLLCSNRIIAFKRSSGDWVDPKIGPMRGQSVPKPYLGSERRSRWQ